MCSSDLLHHLQDDEAESAYSGLQSYSSSRLHTNSSNSSILSGSRSFSRTLTDMAVCDVARIRGAFDSSHSSDADSDAASDDASGVVIDEASRDENIGPPRPEVVSSRAQRNTWYCTHDWSIQEILHDETEIGRFIRNQFLDKKPDKFDLKYLAIAYDSSGLIWPDQFIERLQVTCYLSVAMTGQKARGVRQAQMNLWMAELQPGIVWSSIEGGLYGSAPFMADCESSGQRKFHALVGNVPKNNKKKLEVNVFHNHLFM